MLSVIIVRRGDDAPETGIFDYLSGLFESNLKKISHYVDTDKAEEYVEEVKGMTGIGAALINKSRAEGRLDGIDEGRFLAYFDLVRDGDISIEKAASKLGISSEEFKKKMDEMLSVV